MNRNFIVYPKTKIDSSDVRIQVQEDAPIKARLKSFITGYKEDYGELPPVSYVQSTMNVSEQDAAMALILFGK